MMALSVATALAPSSQSRKLRRAGKWGALRSVLELRRMSGLIRINPPAYKIETTSNG